MFSHAALEMIANAGTANFASLHENESTPIANRDLRSGSNSFYDVATTEMYDKLMNVNVRGVFHAYKYALLRLMEQGKGGRIVGAASIAGKRGVRSLLDPNGNTMLSRRSLGCRRT